MAEKTKAKLKPVEFFYEFIDFFWIPNTLFKTIGYDSLQTTQNPKMRQFLRSFLILLVVSHVYISFYVLRQLFFRYKIDEDLLDIVTLCLCVAYSVNSNVKFLTIFLNRKLAVRISATLADAFPKSIEEKRSYNVNSFFWSKFERYGTVGYIASCWTVFSGPIIYSYYAYRRDNVCPYLRWYLFEYDYNIRKPLIYFGTLLIEAFHSHYTIITNLGTDLWLIAFSTQLCMHLDYIARSIEHYEPHVLNTQENYKFLAKLIKTHKTILNLNEDINQIFGISMIFNLLSTISVFCIVAVRLFAEGYGLLRFILIPFLFAAIAQFFVVCYYGQKLIDTSESIAQACYFQSWYHSSPSYKKMLLIIMVRSQKQAELTAKGLQPISLDTFQIFMGMAYRIFALLQTMLFTNH